MLTTLKKKKQTDAKVYRIQLKYGKSLFGQYILDSRGVNEEEAIGKAKNFIAENGWFMGSPTREEIVERLSVEGIEEIEPGLVTLGVL